MHAVGGQRDLLQLAAAVGIGDRRGLDLHLGVRSGRERDLAGVGRSLDLAAGGGSHLDEVLAAVGIADGALFLGGFLGRLLRGGFLGRLLGGRAAVRLGLGDGGGLRRHVQLAAGDDLSFVCRTVVDHSVVGVHHHAHGQRTGHLSGAGAVRGGRRSRGGRRARFGDLLPFAGELQRPGRVLGHVEEVAPVLVRGDRHAGGRVGGAVLHLHRAFLDAPAGRRVDDDLDLLAGIDLFDAVVGQQGALDADIARIVELQRQAVFRIGHSGAFRQLRRAAADLVEQATDVVGALLFIVEEVVHFVAVIRRRAFHKLDADDDVLVRHVEGILVDVGMAFVVGDVQIVSIRRVRSRAGRQV